MDFVSVRLKTLRGDEPIPFDLYVEVDSQFIKYIEKGYIFSQESLQRFQSKNIKKLYIRFEDEPVYLEYLDRQIKRAYGEPVKDVASQGQFIQLDQQRRVEEFWESLSEASFKQLLTGAELLLQSIGLNPQLLRHLLPEADSTLQEHCVAVAAWVAQFVAQDPGSWKELGPRMVVAALVHDVGFHQEPQLWVKGVKGCEISELARYQKHPEEGVLRLRDLPFVDDFVLRVVREHEQNLDGKGYPQAIVPSRMHSASFVIGAANQVDRLYRQGLSSGEIFTHLLGLYPPEYLTVFRELLEGLRSS